MLWNPGYLMQFLCGVVILVLAFCIAFYDQANGLFYPSRGLESYIHAFLDFLLASYLIGLPFFKKDDKRNSYVDILVIVFAIFAVEFLAHYISRLIIFL